MRVGRLTIDGDLIATERKPRPAVQCDAADGTASIATDESGKAGWPAFSLGSTPAVA